MSSTPYFANPKITGPNYQLTKLTIRVSKNGEFIQYKEIKGIKERLVVNNDGLTARIDRIFVGMFHREESLFMHSRIFANSVFIEYVLLSHTEYFFSH